MISNRRLWRVAGIAAILSTAVLIFGFAYAVDLLMNPKPSNLMSPPLQTGDNGGLENREQLQIVALGDSLTKGTFDLSGKGYVLGVREGLAEQMEKPVRVINNFAVNGYRTDQLLHDLETMTGIAHSLNQADIILFTIGGNDLFSIGMDEVDADVVLARMPEAIERLERIMTHLGVRYPDAVILYIGLYNPFIDLDESGAATLAVQRWNDEAFRLASRYPNMTFVPTFDLFERDGPRFLYSDRFHPNDLGYARIAERVLQVLE